jgi:hypothetical protein
MVAVRQIDVGVLRRHLCADALHEAVRTGFLEVSDQRSDSSSIPLVDALMSAFAMFSLKGPSLLAFDAHRSNRNFRNLYGIEHVPSDTQMRTILDPVSPDELRPAFQHVFRPLQRGKVLESLVFWDDHYLLLLDGTGYFSSPERLPTNTTCWPRRSCIRTIGK